jgi:hypothetical protein
MELAYDITLKVFLWLQRKITTKKVLKSKIISSTKIYITVYCRVNTAFIACL